MKDTNTLLIREAYKQNEHEDNQDKNRGLV